MSSTNRARLDQWIAIYKNRPDVGTTEFVLASELDNALKELKILRAFVTKCHQMVDEDEEATIAEAMFDSETDHGDLQ